MARIKAKLSQFYYTLCTYTRTYGFSSTHLFTQKDSYRLYMFPKMQFVFTAHTESFDLVLFYLYFGFKLAVLSQKRLHIHLFIFVLVPGYDCTALPKRDGVHPLYISTFFYGRPPT